METKTMTKADLVEMLFNRMGMNKRKRSDREAFRIRQFPIAR